MFNKDPMSALEAVTAAQRLAFAPLAFHAVLVMRDRGVLATLSSAGSSQGRSIEEIAATTGMSMYATRVLLEAGLGLHIVWRCDGRYQLGKLGRILLDDEMTRTNFNFTRDICYQAAAHLDESLQEGRAVGLKEFGPWATVYEGLSRLPEPARQSWHAFNHFFSDRAFPAVCDRLEVDPPAQLLDVGCNIGNWVKHCMKRFPAMGFGLVDLPPQLERARADLSDAGLVGRARFHCVDMLDPHAALPTGYELVWMSQFLDCFSEHQIVEILGKVRAALPPHGRLWILELFWDRQRFEAAAFSLQQTSLYFSCVANGNSQIYDSAVFLNLVKRAGLRITADTDGVGGFHTLLECRIAS